LFNIGQLKIGTVTDREQKVWRVVKKQKNILYKGTYPHLPGVAF